MKGKSFLLILALLLAGPVFAAAVADGPGRRDAARCLDCHVNLPLETSRLVFHETAAEVCGGCHTVFPCGPGHDQGAGFLHPVGIVPRLAVPADMPLDRKGRISCITCHPYHGLHDEGAGQQGRGILRRPQGAAFCYSCHKKL